MGLSLGMKIDNWPQMLERWKAQQARTKPQLGQRQEPSDATPECGS